MNNVLSFAVAFFSFVLLSSPLLAAWEEEGGNLIAPLGKVGIGTSDPNAKLDVDGSIAFNGFLRSDSNNGNFRTTQQDGGGRYHQAWNVEGNAIHNGTYYKSNEPALWLKWSTDGWTFSSAERGTAGESINWVPGLKVSTSGNVGVGTHTPSSKLDVAGDVKIDGSITSTGYSRSDSSDGNFRTTQQDGGGRYHQAWNVEGNAIHNGKYYSPNNSESAMWINWYDGFTFNVSNRGAAGESIDWISALRIDRSGKVGIGTTNPTSELEVIGDVATSGDIIAGGDISTSGMLTSNGYSRSDSNDGNFRTTQQDGGGRYHQAWNVEGNAIHNGTYYSPKNSESAMWLKWSDGFTFSVSDAGDAGESIKWKTGLRINNSGNVGVGTHTPSVPLDVNGDAKVSGDLYLSGNVKSAGDICIGNCD